MPEYPSIPRVLTVSRAAEYLSCSGQKVREMCKAGLLPGAFKLGSKRGRCEWRIPAGSIRLMLVPPVKLVEPVTDETIGRAFEALRVRPRSAATATR